MRLGPYYIAQSIISNYPLDAPPVTLDDVLQGIIKKHPEWGCIPEEQSSEWLNKVSQYLTRHINQTIKEGRQPRLSFNSVSNYKIQGACFIEPRDTLDIKQQKQLRLRSLEYYTVLKDLTPENFEVLCSRILTLLGVSNPTRTSYRKDYGIDFFGKMSFGDLIGHGPLFPIFESKLVVWLVGQAKHFLHNKVSTPEIRELIGSTILGRSRCFPNSSDLNMLTIRACDPVIMLFFTTGDISSDGWTLCERSGVLAMDGEMLASFLADKEVGIISKDEHRRFDKEAFSHWLLES